MVAAAPGEATLAEESLWRLYFPSEPHVLPADDPRVGLCATLVGWLDGPQPGPLQEARRGEHLDEAEGALAAGRARRGGGV